MASDPKSAGLKAWALNHLFHCLGDTRSEFEEGALGARMEDGVAGGRPEAGDGTGGWCHPDGGQGKGP